MESSKPIDSRKIARSLNLAPAQIKAAVELLDAGNTVPFITRYRKDQTGGLDEEQIRQIQATVEKQRQLAERRQQILRSVESQGQLTDELLTAIEKANTLKRLDDLYLPYRRKKQTLAGAARERGLEPLAEEILRATAPIDLAARPLEFINVERDLPNVEAVLQGTGHIIAELFSERADLRERLREMFKRKGKLVSTRGELPEAEAKPYRDYFEFAESLGKIPPHRVLAINRGERAKALKARVEVDATEVELVADELLIPAEHPHRDYLQSIARDALSRLILPSLEREQRRELTEAAETHAVKVFARNLRNLLLQPPTTKKRVLAMDPGFKSGCKLAALDEFGGLLDQDVIHLVGNEHRRKQGRERFVELNRKHAIDVIAIGNGTACRETEEFVADVLANELAEASLAYAVVNEAGASVYSTSQLGREEFPDYDATLRGAISIGRRLQDPLSELVKIDAASIGVGLYQHDLKAKHLRESLDRVVESCVNYVGVDLNSASPALLRYVSGLNQLTARRLYEYRSEHGPFRCRRQLHDVPGFGEATFVQSAGFLRIVDGENPLDQTWIHPESYDVAEKVVEQLETPTAPLVSPSEEPTGETAPASSEAEQSELPASETSEAPASTNGFAAESRPLARAAASANVEELSQTLEIGEHLLRDILTQLGRPGRDPREDLPAPMFKKGVLKLEDLEAGMELTGTVLNVVDFGAFVDIGLHDSGLVHISQVANRYVRDPHDVVAVGDIVKVWVMEIDKSRRRVALTMILPGSPKPTRPPRKKQQSRSDKPKTDAGPSNSGGGRRRGKPGGAGQRRTQVKPRPKKPAKPITDEMARGEEPMRTFGDLAQFMDRKPDDDDQPAKK